MWNLIAVVEIMTLNLFWTKMTVVAVKLSFQPAVHKFEEIGEL